MKIEFITIEELFRKLPKKAQKEILEASDARIYNYKNMRKVKEEFELLQYHRPRSSDLTI